jgi:hypothetical protein
MASALRRFLLLSDWSTSGSGLGPLLFSVGKGIGILGRIVVPSVIVIAAIACFIEPKLLLVVAYGGGALFPAWLLVEVAARALMLSGNWWASHFNRSA